MENSTMEDYYQDILSEYLFFIAITVTTALAGLLIQLFIVAVNVIDWLKRRSLTGADQIITSIGISRIFYYTAFLLALFWGFYYTKVPKIASFLTDLIAKSSAISSIWLSTLLSIFFFVKISTSHNVFFLRLKAIILERITYLIFGSVLFSLGYTTIYYFTLPISLYSNSTQEVISYYKQMQVILYINILYLIFPLLVFFIASLLLIILLSFHMSRMNNSGNVTSSMDTYYRIMTFTVLSFLVNALFITTHLSQTYGKFLNFMWFYITMNIFPVLHSILLIYVTIKLRNQFFRIVHCGTDRLFNGKTPGPQSREPDEVAHL